MLSRPDYEVVAPLPDHALIESVALAIWRSHPEYDLIRWDECAEQFRESKRCEARAAIAVILQYFILLEGASRHGDQ